jgi:hypothetical protein
MEGTTSIKNKLSDLEKYEAYLVYHRKSYDKHRDKIPLKKREAYVPTGRSVGIPRKERVVKSVELPQDPMQIPSISSIYC